MSAKQQGARTSYRVALGGIVAALSVLMMFLTGVMPALYIAVPMAAGMLMIILAEEVSEGWAWLTYLAVSLLALTVSFDKEAVLMFVLFFGYYPILRPRIQRIPGKWLRLPVKLVMYNAFLLADFWITVYVLGLPTFEDTMPWMYVILIAAANLLFLLYDRILSRLRWFYREIFVRRVLGRKR